MSHTFGYDAQQDEELQRYCAETERLKALAEFLQHGALIPRSPHLQERALKDFASATEAALEGVRRIAGAS